MKCYVIKNKDGEYLQYFDADSDDIEFTTDLTLAMLYDKNEMNIMKKAYQEFNFVEVTMSEGDLEKQLEEKDREIKQYQERAIIDMNYKEMLELQLDKADKEIIELRRDVDEAIYDRDAKVDLYVREIKHMRQRVCEEIRKQFDNEYYWCYGDNHNNIVIAQEDFYKFLEQIEKGE